MASWAVEAFRPENLPELAKRAGLNWQTDAAYEGASTASGEAQAIDARENQLGIKGFNVRVTKRREFERSSIVRASVGYQDQTDRLSDITWAEILVPRSAGY